MAFEISKEHCCMLLFVCCFLLFLIWIDSPSKHAQTVRSFMGSTPPQLLGKFSPAHNLANAVYKHYTIWVLL